MAQYLSNINLNGNEIQNFVVQPLGTSPASLLKAGRKYFDTTEKREALYDGTKWLLSAYMSDIESISGIATGIDNRLKVIEAFFKDDDESDTLINKWNEIVEFLNATEGDTLESILSGYAVKTRKITAGTGLTGGGTLEADRTISLATVSGLSAGTYRSVTVDTYGRVTKGTNPTTISGYGITDAYTKTQVDSLLSDLDVVTVTQTLTSGKAIATISVGDTDTVLYAPTSYAWSEIASKPTTLSGYGITDAKIASGVITLGSNTIKPLTSHQSIHALKFQVAGTDKHTYTPNSAASTLNFVAGSNISLTYSEGSLTIANTYSYTLPVATSSARGGIKIGYTASGANIPVALSSEKAYVAVTSTAVTTALGFTPYNAANFTAANIKSTLGISDWALEESKPTYSWSEITSKPTIATFMGSTAIGGTSSYAYWNGTAWASQELGDLAFKDSLAKGDVGLGNVTNLAASGYLTALTSNTTNAVSITVGGTTKTIAVSAMKTSLGLKALAYKDSLTAGDVGATKKYATAITKGTATSYKITHSLETRDVVVMVYDPSTYEKVMVDVTMTDTNNVTIAFGSAPTANYRVVVVG